MLMHIFLKSTRHIEKDIGLLNKLKYCQFWITLQRVNHKEGELQNA